MDKNFKGGLMSPFRRKIAQKTMKVDTMSCKNASEVRAKTINAKMLYEIFNDDETHINPLPTPVFIHHDAVDIVTPKIKYYPFIDQRVYKDQKSKNNH